MPCCGRPARQDTATCAELMVRADLQGADATASSTFGLSSAPPSNGGAGHCGDVKTPWPSAP